MTYKVLVVEDDEVDGEWIQRLLRDHSEVALTTNSSDAREYLLNHKVDCVLVDLNLPDVEDLEFVSHLSGDGFPTVILTGLSDLEKAVQGMKAGAFDYLVKGNLEKNRLRTTIEKAHEKRLLEWRLNTQQAELDSAHGDLQEHQNRMALILEHIQEAFWIAESSRDRFVYMSPQAKEIWGLSHSRLEDGHQAILDRVLPEDRERLTKRWCSSEPAYQLDYRLSLDDGATRWLSEKGTRVCQEGKVFWVGVTIDVTEAKQLESQFFQSQKMEALGRLASGLAHDFNNLLTCILGYTDLMKETASSDAAYLDDLKMIEEAGQRGQSLVKDLLTFSRKSVTSAASTELKKAVTDLQTLFGRIIGEDISLTIELPERPAWVNLDRVKLEQVLINLIVNASDAMPDGGDLKISVTPKEGQVLLKVSDTGHGMTEAVKQRVFEPFFTTKGEDGTGLGLATVFGILREANADIELESAPGVGTEFTLRLKYGKPITNGAEASGPAPETKYSQLDFETVLVVENQSELRQMYRRVLEKKGYRVETASDGLEGFMKFRRESARYQALVTDVRMPGVDGRTLAESCWDFQPELPVLFITGSVRKFDSWSERETRMLILEKPFSGPSLTKALEQLLTQEAGLSQ